MPEAEYVRVSEKQDRQTGESIQEITQSGKSKEREKMTELHFSLYVKQRVFLETDE